MIPTAKTDGDLTSGMRRHVWLCLGVGVGWGRGRGVLAEEEAKESFAHSGTPRKERPRFKNTSTDSYLKKRGGLLRRGFPHIALCGVRFKDVVLKRGAVFDEGLFTLNYSKF